MKLKQANPALIESMEMVMGAYIELAYYDIQHLKKKTGGFVCIVYNVLYVLYLLLLFTILLLICSVFIKCVTKCDITFATYS